MKPCAHCGRREINGIMPDRETTMQAETAKLGPWQRGRTLITPTTRQWSAEQFASNELREGRAIYSNFHASDLGKSREVVCKLNEHHPDFEANRALIEAAPDMLQALRDVSKAYQDMFDVMPVAWQTFDNIVSAAIAKAQGGAARQLIAIEDCRAAIAKAQGKD